jgi:peroxiredoxin
VAAGSAASDFTGRDIEGKTIKLSEHLGKNVVLLNFCATWCEPCVAEFPHLRRMYEANKAKGFFVMAIAMDGPETVANVPAFARRNQLNFPMLTDEDSRIASLYNPKKSAPLSILIDKAGKIITIREGYNPGDEEFLAKDVAKALDGAALPQ